MKPTQEQFQEAIKTIRNYAPDRFLNTSVVDGKNNVQHAHLLVRHDGYFHICSPITGEIVTANVSLKIMDCVGEPLTAIGKFQLQHGEVSNNGESWRSESIIIDLDDYLALTNSAKGETVNVNSSYYYKIKSKADLWDFNQEMKGSISSKTKKTFIQKLKSIFK